MSQICKLRLAGYLMAREEVAEETEEKIMKKIEGCSLPEEMKNYVLSLIRGTVVS
jgi:hypothetical protein